ncbi:sensor histidine kinase [Algoriphagus sp.]|uniref:sensor histidine kinase n=1 Tax=Algoriphagus sp. TaxID=1872435 RepID=UPI0039188ED0
MTKNKPTFPNKSKIYWLLQVIGWSSIIFIETINYTFFITGEFKWEFLRQFLLYASVGLIVSHFYKTLFIKQEVFEKTLSKIWIRAFFDVMIITTIMVVFLYLPYVIYDLSTLMKSEFWITFFGQIMNLGRYAIVWIIIYYLYHLLKQNSEITEQKLLIENVAKSAELELLKNQLNPHFLFNALNSIKALVLIDQEKARDAIIKLSELLRFTLNYEKAPLIALNEEINEVIKYLELEQIRFGKRLDVHISLEEETLDLKVPPAMVLTLAENAIKHGITQLPEGGGIWIHSKVRGNLLTLEIINSGQLKSTFNLGIGLQNLQVRLQSLFSGKASFYLDALPDAKVVARISYPIE